MRTARLEPGSNGVAGYLHSSYAESLAESGSPRTLPGSGAWILERPIQHSPYHDAMGCYPLFVCLNWSKLHEDLERMGNGLVCLSVITDPFGEYNEPYLRKCFPDVVAPFKQHFIVDLSRPLDSFVHAHHRRNARKARGNLDVERCARPADVLRDWMALYRTLIDRHNIKGIRTFSEKAFAMQLNVPGIVAFRAVHNEATVGILLWYEQGKRGYYHLGASSPNGYELRASFALFDYAIRHFAQRGFEWLNLGAAAGISPNGCSGLSRFKEGWSTGVRTAYFCGRIFNQKRYREIINARKLETTDFFPAYRAGEVF